MMIDESTAAIAKNVEALEQVTAFVRVIKEYKVLLAACILALCVLLFAPPILTLIVLREVMRLVVRVGRENRPGGWAEAGLMKTSIHIFPPSFQDGMSFRGALQTLRVWLISGCAFRHETTASHKFLCFGRRSKVWTERQPRLTVATY
jgi:hypothetical protein